MELLTAITMEDVIESNRIKKEAIENLRRDLQGTLSQTQLDKLEEIFLSCSEGYIFRRKGEQITDGRNKKDKSNS